MSMPKVPKKNGLHLRMCAIGKPQRLLLMVGRDYRIPETEGIATFTALQRQGGAFPLFILPK
jgi:hypothetical protein